MATNFFLIGCHFEEFRSQVAIRKKKFNFTPCSVQFSGEKNSWLMQNVKISLFSNSTWNVYFMVTNLKDSAFWIIFVSLSSELGLQEQTEEI